MKAPLSIRIKNSLHGIKTVFKKPKYIILAVISGFFVSGLVIWSLNFELMKYIVIDAPISLFSKLRFFWDVQTSIYTSYPSAQATGIALFGLLFGMNMSLIVYVVKNGFFKKIPKKSGSAGLFFAVVSGGCIACGTSILAPLLATLGATSSAFGVNLSNYLNWISIVLIGYSIYSLGSVINNVIHARSKNSA